MKIFLEIPTWLGDAVMATPAIENIVAIYPESELTIFGSFVATKLFVHHPNVKDIIIDESRAKGNRYINLYRVAKEVGRVDIALSFRKHFATKFLLWAIKAKQRFHYRREGSEGVHQVIRYNHFINQSLDINTTPGHLNIYQQKINRVTTKNLTLGINPGATYGSAKRWYPEEFAKVAIALSKRYDIVIFGGHGEVDIASEIEAYLQSSGVTNYSNLAGKTSVEELIEAISQLDLFVTADSGPMHIAAAFEIPTVALFGPTKDQETSQWRNPKGVIVKRQMACAPCMKRVCPLKHHECMKLIQADEVLEAVKALSIT